METGMGQSFAPATRMKSAADFSGHQIVFDSIRNLSYYPHWEGDSMYITEFRLHGIDTVYKRKERVDYIIGSGQHTNSHMTSINGFLYQLPLTWYAQKGKWDLPPGFENGRNIRFNRAIEYECMSCHNALPQLAPGSVNRYTSIPDGIDCERCHGPGEAHIHQKMQGIFVDTSTQIDYSIVNPRKLSWERQIDLCQRCHLQGNAVLKPGKKFSDFRPGMRLNKFVEVFSPMYEGAENEFIMASHAQRLQQSKCFLASNKHVNKEKGKNFATLNLTCITCHNPHVSVKNSSSQQFNAACLKCHQTDDCNEKPENLQKFNSNCVQCHMPKSGSSDIPHVNVHDHKIRIPVDENKLNRVKKFAGLYCVNSAEVSNQTRAAAFINYYEKFEGEALSLDSATYLLGQSEPNEANLNLRIHAAYLKEDWAEIVRLSQKIQATKSQDAWLCYRIGQSYQNLQQFESAKPWYQQCLLLAPDNLDYQNKFGVLFVQMTLYKEAIDCFKHSLALQPKQEDAWVNLGFAYLNAKNFQEAKKCYDRALQLNPDHQQARLNRAAWYHLKGMKNEALLDLKHILLSQPNQEEVLALIRQIQSE